MSFYPSFSLTVSFTVSLPGRVLSDGQGGEQPPSILPTGRAYISFSIRLSLSLILFLPVSFPGRGLIDGQGGEKEGNHRLSSRQVEHICPGYSSVP